MDYFDKLCVIPSISSKLKFKNVSRVVIVYLNKTSLPVIFEQMKVVIENNIDILIVTKTKIDSGFSSSWFMTEGFSISFNFDRNRPCAGIIVYVGDDIFSKHLTKDKLVDDKHEENQMVSILYKSPKVKHFASH